MHVHQFSGMDMYIGHMTYYQLEIYVDIVILEIPIIFFQEMLYIQITAADVSAVAR